MKRNTCMKPVVTTVTVLLVNLAFQTSIAALSYVTLKVSDLAMLVGGTIDSRVLHYLWGTAYFMLQVTSYKLRVTSYKLQVTHLFLVPD